MTGYEGTGVTLPEQREDPWAKTPSLEDLQSAIAKGRVIGEGVTTTFSPRCPDPHKSSRVLSQQFSYQTDSAFEIHTGKTCSVCELPRL